MKKILLTILFLFFICLNCYANNSTTMTISVNISDVLPTIIPSVKSEFNLTDYGNSSVDFGMVSHYCQSNNYINILPETINNKCIYFYNSAFDLPNNISFVNIIKNGDLHILVRNRKTFDTIELEDVPNVLNNENGNIYDIGVEIDENTQLGQFSTDIVMFLN